MPQRDPRRFYQPPAPPQKPTGCPILGANIRRAREARKLRDTWQNTTSYMTQAELAAAVGCSRDTITRIENGQRACSRGLLSQIEQALGVRFDGITTQASAHHMGQFCRQGDGHGYDAALPF